MIGRLLGILGRRAFLTFGLVTFLVGALLATVNVTSRYALKLYVDDQLRRIPWDSRLPAGRGRHRQSLQAHIAGTEASRGESMAYFCAALSRGREVEAQVDRKRLHDAVAVPCSRPSVTGQNELRAPTQLTRRRQTRRRAVARGPRVARWTDRRPRAGTATAS